MMAGHDRAVLCILWKQGANTAHPLAASMGPGELSFWFLLAKDRAAVLPVCLDAVSSSVRTTRQASAGYQLCPICVCLDMQRHDGRQGCFRPALASSSPVSKSGNPMIPE